MLIIALFRLKPDRELDDYRRFSHEYIRPNMIKIPSVVRFTDWSVSRTLDGQSSRWQVAEVFEVTDHDTFIADNQRGIGLEIAERWAEWVEEFEVLLCEDLVTNEQKEG